MAKYLLLYEGGSMPETDASGAGSATGYSVIEADSLDAATDLAKGCPVLAGGASVGVYETFEVM